MARLHRPLPRPVHPAAWWGWAIGLAVAVSTTDNPLLLLLALAVVALVVAARRGSSPWARAFRLYLWLGLAIIVIRVVLHVLVGLKTGTLVVLPLPSVSLPSWAAGIDLGGTVYAEGLLGAAVQGLRLAVVIACVGAANALANPKRLLRALPGALHEIGSAVVVSVSVAPQLAESVQRVRRARRLRGDARRGIRALPAVALPVLEDTLERSLLLAGAMDARGYGRANQQTGPARMLVGTVTLGGLLAGTVGLYGVLDASTPPWMGTPTLAVGLGLSVLGLWLGGRHVTRSVYRPDPWRAAEWLTVGCSAAAAAVLVVLARTSPDALAMPLAPLAVPALPPAAVVALLLGAVPAFVTPEPPRPAPRHPHRHPHHRSARGSHTTVAPARG
ncbi:MAG: CbiQ family ECF transporter T component [Dermatophilaceae bacterium]